MNKHVLLVDDDKICNFITEATLNRLGFAKEIHAVLNGKEALELINKHLTGDLAVPDIIFLDLNMPIMNGFQFIEAFEKLDFPKKNNVTIVVLTSSENPEDIIKAKKLGVSHYMTKPINEAEVIALFNN
jgi:CheY-like chemotaxis protein